MKRTMSVLSLVTALCLFLGTGTWTVAQQPKAECIEFPHIALWLPDLVQGK